MREKSGSTASPRVPARLLALATALVGSSAAASAQTSFSIGFRGPTIAVPDPTGIPITEGDILVPSTATGLPALAAPPPPTIAISAGPGLALPVYPGCVGMPPGSGCGLEVDALSYGLDGPAVPAMPAGSYYFSVDKDAVGRPTPLVPSVLSEGATVFLEASADVFQDLGGLAPPTCPLVILAATSVGAIDGDGLANGGGVAYPGLGLVEINPPGCPPPPFDLGDTLDAIDVDGPFGPVYFSLDGFVVDPLCGVVGTGSAILNGPFSCADVLVSPAALPAVYAPAAALGLDLIGGFASDDLDALALFENGDGVFQPSLVPFDWLGGATDMLLFSVRRGSAVVGAPASNCGGMPIEPGDVLTTPVAGGLTPFPAIFIAAEALGLATTRTAPVVLFGDDLDALDVSRRPPLDCQCNGVPDAVEIAGGVADTNTDGVPDECQRQLFYCTAKTTSAGCVPFLTTSGTPSASGVGVGPFNVFSNDHVEGLVGFYIYSFAKNNLNFHGGKLCVKAPFQRLQTLVKATDGVPCTSCPGNCRMFKRNFNQLIQSGSDPMLTCGQRVFTQFRQRDSSDPLGFGDNLSNGVRFLITP